MIRQEYKILKIILYFIVILPNSMQEHGGVRGERLFPPSEVALIPKNFEGPY
jgi:hypothetical protein